MLKDVFISTVKKPQNYQSKALVAHIWQSGEKKTSLILDWYH